MSLPDLASLGSFVSGVAVLASLVFPSDLASRGRLNTAVVRREVA
jgi:hypothetical protein